MTREADQQCEKRIQSEVNDLLMRTSGIHLEVSEATRALILEVDHWRNLAKAATLNAEKMEADYEAVLDCRDARHREMELAYNDAIDAGSRLMGELEVAKGVAWSCVLITVVCMIGMLYGAYN